MEKLEARNASFIIVDGAKVIDAISYRLTTDAGHFESSVTLTVKDLDPASAGFVTDPTAAQLSDLATSQLKSDKGAEGCATAWDTLVKQIADNAVVVEEVTPDTYEVEGLFKDPEPEAV